MEAAGHSNLLGIAAVALAALVGGIVMERLRQPALVGYILAGVVLGPAGFELVQDRHAIDTLAEMGVLMLLFLIGMELPIRVFKRMWRVALFTTLAQIGGSIALMLLAAQVWGWSWGHAMVLGFVVAVSSTAVAIKILENSGELNTRAGRITVGVLIAQDLAVVPMMLAIQAVGVGTWSWLAAAKIIASIGFMVWLIWYLGRGRRLRLPGPRALKADGDMTALTALAFCFGAAALSGILGMSPAYGAFLAGLVVGASTQAKTLTHASHPIQAVLMMVFFVSVGLLLDPAYLWDNLGAVLMVFLVVTVFKGILNVGVLHAMGQPWEGAFLAGVTLSQIGEFSFLLAVMGRDAGLITADDSRLVIAVTVLSLALSPLCVVAARRIHARAKGVREGDSLGRVLNVIYREEAQWVRHAGSYSRSLAIHVRDAIERHRANIGHRKRHTPDISPRKATPLPAAAPGGGTPGPHPSQPAEPGPTPPSAANDAAHETAERPKRSDA